MSDELTTEVKSILHNLRVTDGAVARKTVRAIGNGVLKARCRELLEENGGSITLTTKWARGVLKSLDWVKKRYTTAKTEMNPALYEELTFYWKRKIANVIFELRMDSQLRTNLHLLGKWFILYPSQMLTINVKLQLLSALTLLVIFYQYS